MNFCDGYEIDFTAVIGIGPLKIERFPDQAIIMMYGRFRYQFKLFFQNYETDISSDWVDTRGIEQEKIVSWTAYSQLFKEDYNRVREIVINSIKKSE
jgi:hypothetical protein